jgi:hypothetical protein
MGLLPTHWYYNTESGQLTTGNNLGNLGNNLIGGAGWHELNIPGSDTGVQAVAAAKAEFPKGATPTYGNPASTLAKGAAKGVANAAKDALGLGTGTGSTNPCLLSIPVLGGCALTKTEARAMIAGLIIGASGLIGLIGVMLIVAEGFRKSGAAHAAGGALETVGAATAFVPGLEGAGIALGATGAAARRAGSSSGASQSIQRRQDERESRRVAAAKAAGTTAKGQTP